MARGFCEYAGVVEKVEVNLRVEMQSPAFAWVIKAVLEMISGIVKSARIVWCKVW